MSTQIVPNGSPAGTTLPVSQLQAEAWAMWNESYYASEREAYRVVSLALYQQDTQERIAALFTRSDEQNALIDALLGNTTVS
ncbi:MAG TPA: hypothetical protein VF221_16770 [Chloroflexota bacterium]